MFVRGALVFGAGGNYYLSLGAFMLKKGLAILAITSLLTSCANNNNEALKRFSPINYNQNSSLAKNTLGIVFVNRYLADAKFSQHDWKKQKENTNGESYFTKQLMSRSSNINRQLSSKTDFETTRPFDQPNILTWVEVSSVNNFDTERFKNMIYQDVNRYLLNALQADIENNFELNQTSGTIEFSGSFCEDMQNKLHPNKIKNGEWIGSEKGVTCFANFEHEIVRPIFGSDWRPAKLGLDKDDEYVLVRTRISNYETYLYAQKFEKSLTYFPARRTTQKRGRSLTTGKSTPFMLHKNSVYLFVEPNNRQEAKIPATNWIKGNKLP